MRVTAVLGGKDTVISACRSSICRAPITSVWVEPCGMHAQRIEVHVKCADNHSQLSSIERVFERVDIDDTL